MAEILKINQVLNQDSITDLTKKNSNIEKANLRNVTDKGVDYLDLIGGPVTGKDFAQAEEFFRLNYEKDYPAEKFIMLFDLIKEDNWSAERFKATVKWFLKYKKWDGWKIADWFEYGEKLYPYSWYQEQISKGVKHEDMQGYRINGVVLWKLKDNRELPFEKI